MSEDVDATNVIVTETLPPEVTFMSAAATRGSYDSQTSLWSIKLLPAGQSARLTIAVTVNDTTVDGRVLINTVDVKADQQDSNNSNDRASEETTVQVRTVDLAIIKQDSVDPVFAGALLGYILTVTNNSLETATGVSADRRAAKSAESASGNLPEGENGHQG